MGRYGKIREEKGKRREEKGIAYEESIVVCLSWYAFSVSAAI